MGHGWRGGGTGAEGAVTLANTAPASYLPAFGRVRWGTAQAPQGAAGGVGGRGRTWGHRWLLPGLLPAAACIALEGVHG